MSHTAANYYSPLAVLPSPEREVFLRAVAAARTWLGGTDRAASSSLELRLAFWEIEDARANAESVRLPPPPRVPADMRLTSRPGGRP